MGTYCTQLHSRFKFKRNAQANTASTNISILLFAPNPHGCAVDVLILPKSLWWGWPVSRPPNVWRDLNKNDPEKLDPNKNTDPTGLQRDLIWPLRCAQTKKAPWLLPQRGHGLFTQEQGGWWVLGRGFRERGRISTTTYPHKFQFLREAVEQLNVVKIDL